MYKHCLKGCGKLIDVMHENVQIEISKNVEARKGWFIVTIQCPYCATEYVATLKSYQFDKKED